MKDAFEKFWIAYGPMFDIMGHPRCDPPKAPGQWPLPPEFDDGEDEDDVTDDSDDLDANEALFV